MFRESRVEEDTGSKGKWRPPCCPTTRARHGSQILVRPYRRAAKRFLSFAVAGRFRDTSLHPRPKLKCKELIRFMADHDFEIVDVVDASFSEDAVRVHVSARHVSCEL